MEEIEVSSWLTLDAIKKAGKVIETVGDLQTGHCQSVFCIIEDDHLELCYSDTASSYIRRYEDKEELEVALAKRKEEEGEMLFDENQGFEEDEFGEEEEEEGEEFDISDESDKY